MRLIRFAAIAIAAAGLIAAAQANWLATVAVGPGGSHVMGNPNAKVKLTEFVSYTCPHCADFQKQSDVPLRVSYVQPGKVSIEVRHFLRDSIDLAAALATNCGDPKKFFGNHSLFLQTQDKWIAAMDQTSAAQKARWSTGPMSARMRAIAFDLGFYRMMEQRGYGRPELDRCLADEAMARKLSTQTSDAQAANVVGTPSFMLNGTLLAGTHSWESLVPQLDARF